MIWVDEMGDGHPARDFIIPSPMMRADSIESSMEFESLMMTPPLVEIRSRGDPP